MSLNQCLISSCLWGGGPLLSWRFLGGTPPPAAAASFLTLLIGCHVHGGLLGSCVLSGPPGEPPACLFRTKETKKNNNAVLVWVQLIVYPKISFCMKISRLEIDLWKQSLVQGAGLGFIKS